MEQGARVPTRCTYPLTITMSDLYRSAMLNKLPQVPTVAPFSNDDDDEENETDALGALPSSSMPPPRSYASASFIPSGAY